MLQVYILDISPLYDMEMYTRFYQQSALSRKQKADKLKQQTDKARCIGAGILFIAACRKYSANHDKKQLSHEIKAKELARANSFGAYIYSMEDAEMEDKLVQYTQSGKPYLKMSGTSLPQYNISHSGDYVVMAIGEHEVGIDIQKVVKVREAVVNRCFSACEKQLVYSIDEAEGLSCDQVFSRIWTQKEAASKLDGTGISRILEEQKEGEQKVRELFDLETTKIQLESMWVNRDYVITLACNEADAAIIWNKLDETEVFKC